MLAKAASLGCPPKNGVPDAACLCANKDFGYGIRDCTNESCPSGTDTNQVIQYGVGYCLQGKFNTQLPLTSINKL